MSLLTLAHGHLALEVGMVGREGMLGIPVALGMNDSPVRALQQVVHLYIHERMVQITQTAACNRFHPIEGRLARWLLMTRDRVRSDQFHLTHELLGSRLGVLRVAVTNVAGALQQRKPIPVKQGTVRKLPPPVSLDAYDQGLLDQVVFGYYTGELKHSPEALAYPKARGIDDPAALEQFKLGYANRTLGLRIPNSQRVTGSRMRERLQAIGILRESGHEHFNGSLVILP